jgi:acyl-CoA thioesterase
MTEGFFVRHGDRYFPSDQARGPWDPDSMHGRVLAGLLGRAMEQAYGDPALQFSRLTVDLFRLPPMQPIQVTVSLIREGNRIRVADGVITSDGVEMARGRGVMLKRAEPGAGNVWRAPDWQVPHPDEIPESRWRPALGGKWETRPIAGTDESGISGAAQKRVWLRELRPLVEGEELTPLVRAALAADYTSPLANSGDDGLHYVNADFTLYLSRLPAGEWIGFEVTDHQSAEGIALGDCRLYDLTGPIGTTTVCAVANRPIRPR